MRAAVWTKERELVVEERAIPEPPPGWARIRIGATGICGTDLHVKHGAMLPALVGMQPGHEMAGVIDAAGEGVDLAIGTAVAIEPIHSCGQCRLCRSGKHNLCTGGMQLMGLGANGGMADYLLAHRKQLYPLAAGVPLPVGALAEPMAVAVRGLRLGQVVQGTSVAVLGAGTIGLMCVAAAVACGAEGIFVTARHPHQADLARKLGATGVFGDGDALHKAVRGRHIDAVIETVGGTAPTLSEAVAVAGPGARIVMLGLFEGALSLPGLPFLGKELQLLASNCYAFDHGHSEFGLAVGLVGRLRSSIEGMITHTYGLDRVNEAFAAAADKQRRCIKVQIHP